MGDGDNLSASPLIGITNTTPRQKWTSLKLLHQRDELCLDYSQPAIALGPGSSLEQYHKGARAKGSCAFYKKYVFSAQWRHATCIVLWPNDRVFQIPPPLWLPEGWVLRKPRWISFTFEFFSLILGFFMLLYMQETTQWSPMTVIEVPG